MRVSFLVPRLCAGAGASPKLDCQVVSRLLVEICLLSVMDMTPPVHKPAYQKKVVKSLFNILALALSWVTLHCGTSCLQAAPVPPTDNTAPPYMGIYTWALSGTSCLPEYSYTSAWLYRQNIWIMDFDDYSSWSGIEAGGGVLNNAQYWLRTHPSGTFYYTVGMLPGTSGNPGVPLAGTSLQLGATGTFNSHFQTLATNLISHGLVNNTVIRLGHEFNGNWYPWWVSGTASGSSNNAAYYAAYYHQIVTAMRSTTLNGTSAANLKFDWNAAGGYWTSWSGTAAYPGSDVVDFIGCDLYDQCTSGTTCYPYQSNVYPYPPDASWRQTNAWTILSANYNNGLTVWKNIAASYGKPMTIPEWGVTNRPSGPAGGLDDPAFIQRMYNFIQDPANNVYFHSYFNASGGNSGTSQLTSYPGFPATIYPNAAAAFQQYFGVAPLAYNYDIGAVGISGTSTVISITGAGAGCLTGTSGTSDNFHFAALGGVTGDETLMIQLTSTSAAPAGAQVGLMLRQSTDPGAPYAALLVSNGNYVFQSRTSAGTASVQNVVIKSGTTPIWLKLGRLGNVIAGYTSQDGLNWLYAGSQTVAMTGTAYIGAAISSGSTTGSYTTGIQNVDNYDINYDNTGSIGGSLILDDSSSTGITKSGTWLSGTATSAWDVACNSNVTFTRASNTGCTISYSPNLAAGAYDVYGLWPTANAYGDNIPVSVVSTGGTSVGSINQMVGTHLWNYIGGYSFASGTGGSVSLNNAGTDGYTVADAFMFVPRPGPASSLPIADAYVRDGTYSGSNFGTATTLDVKLDAVGTDREAYLKFNVAGMTNIKRALLQLMPTYVNTDPGATYTVEFVADDSWTETGITWNNKPAGSGTILGQLGGLKTNASMAIDITSQVKAEAAGDGVLSVHIYSNSAGGTKSVSWGSKEQTSSANQPQLLVQ